MYIPKHFEVTDDEALIAFMGRYNFALLISQAENIPFATHIPISFDYGSAGDLLLCGHVARTNPHAELLKSVKEHLIVFSGPHAYISPSWYESNPNVPTWNYAAVHVYGSVEIVEGPDLLQILKDTVQQQEYSIENKTPWSMESLPNEYIEKMQQAIVGFRMTPTHIEGKWKMSQNKSRTDIWLASTRLEKQGSPNQIEVAKIMNKMLEGKDLKEKYGD